METFHAITQLIEQEIPDLKQEPGLEAQEISTVHLFQTLVNFSAYTEKMILIGDLARVKKCFQLAENLYRKGNEMVKVAFEHIFIPRLHLEIDDRTHQMVRAMLPFCLLRTYLILYRPNQLEK